MSEGFSQSLKTYQVIYAIILQDVLRAIVIVIIIIIAPRQRRGDRGSDIIAAEINGDPQSRSLQR